MLELKDCRISMNEPIMNEKKPTPASIKNIATHFSIFVLATMSPYPTVERHVIL